MGRLTKRHPNGVVGISECRYYNYDDFQKIAKKLADYEDVGTEEEFRELKEKATAKKVIKLEGNGYYDYKCPTCGFPGLNCLKMDYCKCGQKLDYSEEKE